MDDQNKNLILATVLSFVVIAVWFFLFPPEELATTATEPTVAEQTAATTAPTAESVATDGTTTASPTLSTEAEVGRITIDSPELTGSINLRGGRIDDVYLSGYRETIEEDSPTVRLLRPYGENDAYFAGFGWIGNVGVAANAVPGPDTIWTLDAGETLTPTTPVTLKWDNGAGLVFRTTYSIDEKFMISVEQTVENNSGQEVTVTPYGLIRRYTEPDGLKRFFVLFEGLVRMNNGSLDQISYKDIREENSGTNSEDVTAGGWIGYTDHYWMTTLIPDQDKPFQAVSRYFTTDVYEADAILGQELVAAGATAQVSSRLFVGAKEWETIRAYQNDNNVHGFINTIDWGWFFFLTKPIFWLLHNIHALIGNMGWSIMALTLVLKALVLPLAYKSYVSMAKMKELQPEMEKLKEAAGDDRAKLQQGMMKLYRDNKVNPASGCLPMLIQIPIFFSLYKVIFVTLELRQAPWLGWIRDLSAPDPSSILNLFGLLPYATPEPGSMFFILSLGVLPIILGISMWLQQKLNPAPTDPSQKMIFAFMPWIFMFMLGGFASGLVLYWITNNTITFLQQYAIMRSHGHRPDILGNIFSRKSKAKAAK